MAWHRYKFVKSLYLISLLDLFRRQIQACLILNKTNISYGDRALVNSGPAVWNRLPVYIRTEESVALFKKNVKTYLFIE